MYWTDIEQFGYSALEWVCSLFWSFSILHPTIQPSRANSSPDIGEEVNVDQSYRKTLQILSFYIISLVPLPIIPRTSLFPAFSRRTESVSQLTAIVQMFGLISQGDFDYDFLLVLQIFSFCHRLYPG
jgi:hypothetical protein